MNKQQKTVAVVLVLICVALGIVAVLPPSDRDGLIGLVLIMFLGLVGFAFYFLPAVVAIVRKHHQIGPIIIVNLLLGWTFLGWVVACAWSLSSTPNNRLSGNAN